MVDLHRLAEKINIHDLAVCDARPFLDVEHLLRIDEAMGILPPFVHQDICERVEPERTLSGAASFIVILESYQPSVYKPKEGLYGNISPAACGEDYHRIVQRKLRLLTEALETADPEGQYLSYVDNSPFSEKHVALRSGLGRIMKNGLFYSKRFGSRCYIGLILSDRPPESFDLEIRKDGEDPLFDRCQTCKACEKFCPGEAIGPEGMHSYRCVSYLTQKKEALTEEEERSLGRQVYGCDICQKVCPLNGPIDSELETGMEVALDELLSMTNSQFKRRYQHMAAAWRGKKQLQKNAEIVKKNILER